MSSPRRDFLQRLLSTALLIRLGAIAVALVGLVGVTMTAAVLACVLVLSGSTLALMLSPRAIGLVVRHPMLLVVDVLLSLGTVAALGVESPLVLATFSSALVVGLLVERRSAIPVLVVMCSGYGLVVWLEPGVDSAFMLTVGVPMLYVAMAAIGSAARIAHEHHTNASAELERARNVAAVAEERARLAREMHDSLGKTIHGLALAARALPMWVERDPATAVRQAQALADGADQAALEARELLRNLRLEETDRPTIEVVADVCRRWEEEHGVPCRFTTAGVADLEPHLLREVLAIVCEALENVARHARASSVEVTFVRRGAGWRVAVEDDGEGFAVAPDGRGPAGHYGLVGMAERAAEIGAVLDVRSRPRAGTRVVLDHAGTDTDRPVGQESDDVRV